MRIVNDQVLRINKFNLRENPTQPQQTEAPKEEITNGNEKSMNALTFQGLSNMMSVTRYKAQAPVEAPKDETTEKTTTAPAFKGEDTTVEDKNSGNAVSFKAHLPKMSALNKARTLIMSLFAGATALFATASCSNESDDLLEQIPTEIVADTVDVQKNDSDNILVKVKDSDAINRYKFLYSFYEEASLMAEVDHDDKILFWSFSKKIGEDGNGALTIGEFKKADSMCERYEANIDKEIEQVKAANIDVLVEQYRGVKMEIQLGKLNQQIIQLQFKYENGDTSVKSEIDNLKAQYDIWDKEFDQYR